MKDNWMLYSKPCVEGTPMIPIPYRFLEPTKVVLRDKNGVRTSICYGIGDLIYVLEPSVQLLVACYDRLEKIPLADGSFIIEFPKDMRTEKGVLNETNS